MPTGPTNRPGSKGPHTSTPLGVEKKVGKQPLKAVKDKILRAKAKALDKKEALKIGHAERKARFESGKVVITRKHFQDSSRPDKGAKATRERTNRNVAGDAKSMKVDGREE